MQRVAFETHAFQMAPLWNFAGALLKADAVVHGMNELEEIRRTRNSHWHRHPALRWNECLC